MLTCRLQERTPSATKVDIGFVQGRELRFHKVSADGSGKCDMAQGDDNDRVHGVVFEVSESERSKLDQAEGLGKGYDAEYVRVVTEHSSFEAWTYIATKTDPARRPYHWYKDFVVAGANEHGLHPDYVGRIRSVGSIDDPVTKRAASNRAILNRGQIRKSD